MAFSLIPAQVHPTIYDIDHLALAAAGIRLLLADLDNTLVPYGVASPTAEVRIWKERLQNDGIKLFILSNNRSATRVRLFSEDLGVPFIGHAGKPKAASFHQAMEQMRCTHAQTAMVGDQLYTDVLGANNAGVQSILVKPIAWGKNPLRILRYAAETPFRTIGKRSGVGR